MCVRVCVCVCVCVCQSACANLEHYLSALEKAVAEQFQEKRDLSKIDHEAPSTHKLVNEH